MKIRAPGLVLVLLLISASSNAYNDRLEFGTISAGLAGADAACPSAGSGLRLYPAFPFSKYSLSVGLHHSAIYNIPGLNSNLATIRFSKNRHSLGMEYSRLGKNDLYIEENIRLGMGFPFKKFYFGILVDRLTIDISNFTNYGNYTSAGFSGGFYTGAFGVSGSLSGLKLGSKNIGNDEIHKLYLFGLYYKIKDYSAFYSTFGSHSSGEWLSIGQSFFLGELLTMQVGLKSEPVSPAFGMSVMKGSLTIGYSYLYHPNLGDTHQAGLIINMNPRNANHASK